MRRLTRRTLVRWLLAWTIGVLGAPASADRWAEVGEAAELPPGQITRGEGMLTAIDGSFSRAEDVDLYRIRLDDPGAFSATTAGVLDPILYLFEASGLGIAANDDNGEGFLQATLPMGDPLYEGLASGEYLLGIAKFERAPVSAAGRLFPFDLFMFSRVEAPTGPGGTEPLLEWMGDAFGAPGAYTIELTGAGFAVPEPAGLAGPAAGLLASLVLARRVRRRAG